jgi:N-acetylmuramoyl-L-alanine amidase
MRPVYLAPAPSAAGCPTSTVPAEPGLTPIPAAPTTSRATTIEPGLEPASVPAEAPLNSTPAGPSIPRIDSPPPVTGPTVPGKASDEPGMGLEPAGPDGSKVPPAKPSGSGSKAPSATLNDNGLGTPTRGRRVNPSPTVGRVRSASLRDQVRPYVNDPADLFAPPKADRPWKYIVLHHSASATGGYASIDAEHRQRLGWNGCGYHFVIGNGSETPDGKIEVSQRWVNQKLGVHCRDGKNPDVSEYGIGICLVGDLEKSPPTPRQIAAAKALVAYLGDRYQVAPDHTETHAHLAASPTSCPGRLFPAQAILNPSGLALRDR